MIAWFRRVIAFTRFTIQEYTRSGRIMIEFIAIMAALWLFFWPRGVDPAPPSKLFNLGGLFILGLTVYTTASIMGLGNRPQGYIVLARRLGRRGYLTGLYLAALGISVFFYLVLSLAVIVLWAVSKTLALSVSGWLLGTLPMLLNIALLSAFITLISPLVLSPGMRLLLLGVLAIALSTDIERIGQLEIIRLFKPIQSLLSFPLLPPMHGFNLAVHREYNLAALGTLLGQVALLTALLAFALASFDRKELMLAG